MRARRDCTKKRRSVRKGAKRERSCLENTHGVAKRGGKKQRLASRAGHTIDYFSCFWEILSQQFPSPLQYRALLLRLLNRERERDTLRSAAAAMSSMLLPGRPPLTRSRPSSSVAPWHSTPTSSAATTRPVAKAPSALPLAGLAAAAAAAWLAARVLPGDEDDNSEVREQ